MYPGGGTCDLHTTISQVRKFEHVPQTDRKSKQLLIVFYIARKLSRKWRMPGYGHLVIGNGPEMPAQLTSTHPP